MEYRVKLQYYFTLSKEYIGKILKIGIPSAFEQVMYQACQIVFLYYATYLGTESLDNTLRTFLCSLIYSLLQLVWEQPLLLASLVVAKR